MPAKGGPPSHALHAGRAGRDDAPVPGKGWPVGKLAGGPRSADGRAPGQSESTTGGSAKSGPPEWPAGNAAGAGGHAETAGQYKQTRSGRCGQCVSNNMRKSR